MACSACLDGWLAREGTRKEGRKEGKEGGRATRCNFHLSFATASHFTHGAAVAAHAVQAQSQSQSFAHKLGASKDDTILCNGGGEDRIVGHRERAPRGLVVHIGYWTHVLMAVRACLISRCDDRPTDRLIDLLRSFRPSFLELIVLALPLPPKLLRPPSAAPPDRYPSLANERTNVPR